MPTLWNAAEMQNISCRGFFDGSLPMDLFSMLLFSPLDEPDLPEANIEEKGTPDRKKPKRRRRRICRSDPLMLSLMTMLLRLTNPELTVKMYQEMTKLLGVPEMKRKALFCCKISRAGDLL
jgi:hypothetical protein